MSQFLMKGLKNLKLKMFKKTENFEHSVVLLLFLITLDSIMWGA